jgi:hypothetical protein
MLPEAVAFVERVQEQMVPTDTAVTIRHDRHARLREFDSASNLDRPGVFRLNVGSAGTPFVPSSRQRRLDLAQTHQTAATTTPPWTRCCRTPCTHRNPGPACSTRARTLSTGK